jgi:hypothetical protein
MVSRSQHVIIKGFHKVTWLAVVEADSLCRLLPTHKPDKQCTYVTMRRLRAATVAV